MSYIEKLKKVRPELVKRRGRDKHIGCPGNHFVGAPMIHDDDCFMEPTCEAYWMRSWDGEPYQGGAAV